VSRHRAEPPRRRATTPANRHAATRPRFGRIGLLGVSAAVCATAFLGGTGVLPSRAGDDDPTVARDLTGESSLSAVGDSAVLVLDSAQDELPEDPPREEQPAPPDESVEGQADGQADGLAGTGQGSPESPGRPGSAETDRPENASADESLPKDSGDGYRVVFSEGRQRVWLVGSDGSVARTYPVSGSLYDNLDPGTYEVYSRSEQAYAFDGSGSMKYFVRFAEGDTGAAIGFHDIPLDNSGELVQEPDQLGTAQSHGCVRQERADAIALWEFAPIGTVVVVV
jgi:hypothetical protein